MLPAVPNSGDPPASAPPPELSSAAATASADLSEDERGRNEDGGRSSAGNRWPRQETLYLLKIRSDMDAAFRDSSLKGPLWEEVSRKLAALGFHRSAKKCKEKFENVYKYHKRIKEGRGSKSEGKTYKFFEQLEALEASTAAGSHHQPPLSLPPPPPVQSSMLNPQIPSVELQQNNVDPISVAAPDVNPVGRFPFSEMNLSVSTDSSSSTDSEDEPVEKRQGRKRKWKEFFGRLMKEVIDKQEELQSKFLNALEQRERERAAREEAWRMQEMAKMKREHELLVQERSMVAAKDAAVITFLQKIADQNPTAGIPQIPAMQLLQQQQQNQNPAPTQALVPAQQPQPQPQPQMQPEQPPPQAQQTQPASTAPAVPVSVAVPAIATANALVMKSSDNTGGGGDALLQPSPSRWPKAEINALIQIRTSLDTKYQESGPKGPLWEEVSAAMRNLGYNRNAKRCKEKWENINKYYKKVKESSKKRPEDSKTCPYFHQLDAIYREKEKAIASSSSINNNPGLMVKPEAQMAPIMARPEQQWPHPAVLQEQQHRQYQQQQQQQSKVNVPRGTEDHQNADLNDDDYDDDEEEDDDDDDDEGGDYEVVQNKTSSMAAVE